MSTDEQATWDRSDEFAVRAQRETALSQYDGAVYGIPKGIDVETDAEENCCRNCERDLSAAQARICGDNDGCVPQCDECSQYHTVATAVDKYYQSNGGLL